ncbi:hypothetical protein JVU11DRAFT_2978 [Chiua virens]|nr:hypothetical protein JVU11DRAFT_2978 [Chiua virens]
MFRVHREWTLRHGFHVGTTWYSDRVLELFMIRAGTGAVLPSSVDAEDDREYTLGVVNFAVWLGSPDDDVDHGELVRGGKYVGPWIRTPKWGWEKLGTDPSSH